MPASPYHGKPESRWLKVTQKLVAAHPLTSDVLLAASLAAWDTLWRTQVGTGATAVPLASLSVPATVIGYFFEVLLSRELEARFPSVWRGSSSKNEKDLMYLPNPLLSVEVTTSGQHGYRIFGNRSYGQKSARRSTAAKEKSGYYVTVNFYGQVLTLIRFGWIVATDWNPQKSQTGQMAGVSDAVYRYKLLSIPGDYRANAPATLLAGVGPTAANHLQQLGIHTIRDLLGSQQTLPASLAKLITKNASFLAHCR